MDRSAIEDLFERNADMRLLELRHGETGRTSGAVRHVTGGFGAESSVEPVPGVPQAVAPRLRVAVSAVPKTGVIPGALVGVAIDVFNDGNAPAPESKLVLSLPIETEFRSGTLRVDGREVPAPERLFGDGLPIARLPGSTSSKVVFQLQVTAGLNPLYLQPRLQSNGVPVVGTPGISIKRATAPGTRTAAVPERPFYELDETEIASEAAAGGADAIVPPVLPPSEPSEPAVPALDEPALPPAEPAPAKRARRAPVQAAVVADDVPPDEVAPPDSPPPPAAVPASPARPVRGVPAADVRMSRYRTLATNDVAVLDRLFANATPGIVAHYLLIAAIVCNEPEAGPDLSGYGAFLRTDAESLGRALVMSRFGKPIDYQVAQASLDGLDLPWEPTGPPTTTPRRSPRRLRRDLSKTECRAIAGLMQPSKRDPQLRLRIALLALAAATIEGVSRAAADECVTALASYRSAVLAWLIPLCIASMNDRAPAVPQPPANVDLAGRRVVATLRAALAE